MTLHIQMLETFLQKKKSLLSPGFQGQNSDCWAQQQMTFLLSYFAYVTLSIIPLFPVTQDKLLYVEGYSSPLAYTQRSVCIFCLNWRLHEDHKEAIGNSFQKACQEAVILQTIRITGVQDGVSVLIFQNSSLLELIYFWRVFFSYQSTGHHNKIFLQPFAFL